MYQKMEEDTGTVFITVAVSLNLVAGRHQDSWDCARRTVGCNAPRYGEADNQTHAKMLRSRRDDLSIHHTSPCERTATGRRTAMKSAVVGDKWSYDDHLMFEWRLRQQNVLR